MIKWFSERIDVPVLLMTVATLAFLTAFGVTVHWVLNRDNSPDPQSCSVAGCAGRDIPIPISSFLGLAKGYADTNIFIDNTPDTIDAADNTWITFTYATTEAETAILHPIPDTVYVVDTIYKEKYHPFRVKHGFEFMLDTALIGFTTVYSLTGKRIILSDSAKWAPFEKPISESNPQPVTCACTPSAIGPCDKYKGLVVKR